jgi:hypothetical protein
VGRHSLIFLYEEHQLLRDLGRACRRKAHVVLSAHVILSAQVFVEALVDHLRAGCHASAWWSAVGPILKSVLLVRVSGVALLEKHIGECGPQYA